MKAKSKAPIRSAPTASQQAVADVTALIKARNPLLWVTTDEEMRVERALTEAAAAAAYDTRRWDCATGLFGASDRNGAIDPRMQAPNEVLGAVAGDKSRRVWILRDLHRWLDPVITRQLRSLARQLQGAPRDEARCIVIMCPPGSEIPPELKGSATVIDWPLPERPEIEGILADVIESLPDGIRETACDDRDAAIDAAVGLTAEQASACYAKSLVLTRRIDPALVAGEKKRVVNAVPGVEWYDPDPRGLDAVGGLDLLKPYLRQRASAFGARARAFGLPCPKGALLVGIPGCGKSLTAKAVAAAWQVPLLRLDLGALKSKWIGESEGNIRQALAVAETIGRCVLWLDELEKALAGASSGTEAGDGGVAKDALGTILTWMQERVDSGVYVIATANDVSSLPPELLRRFDATWFVDLPTQRERQEIARAAMRSHRRDPDSIDAEEIATATAAFSGAEIAGLVPEAMFAAFADGERDVTTADLLDAADRVVPLSKTAADKIAKVREWAASRARPASRPEETGEQGGARALDL